MEKKRLILNNQKDMFRLEELIYEAYKFIDYKIWPESQTEWTVVFDNKPLFKITTAVANRERNLPFNQAIKINESKKGNVTTMNFTTIVFEKDIMVEKVEGCNGEK